jgi:hypothetical protein
MWNAYISWTYSEQFENLKCSQHVDRAAMMMYSWGNIVTSKTDVIQVPPFLKRIPEAFTFPKFSRVSGTFQTWSRRNKTFIFFNLAIKETNILENKKENYNQFNQVICFPQYP